MASFARIMYEWNHLGLGAFKLTSSDGKALTWLSIQMQNNFEHDLAISRLFAKYTDKQLENVKDIHKGDRPHCWWLHKSLPTFLNHYPTSIWCRYEMYYTPYSLQLLNFLARVYYDISKGQKNLCYRPVRKDTGQRECWPMRMTAHKDKCPGGPMKAKAWEAHSLGRHGPRAAAFGHLINPFTAPACKISRLKKVHTHTHANFLVL